MPLPATSLSPCSEISVDAGEKLLGSAPNTTHWLLLEYPGAFGQNALADSALALKVKDHLERLLVATPDSKLLLIKDRTSLGRACPRLFIGTISPDGKRRTFLHLELNQYTDLLGYANLESLVATAEPHLQPLVLVCTNGRRDQCCARLGLPLFNSLTTNAALSTFECSHVGQHRFAPNLLVFPGPYYYGRITVEDANSFAQSVIAEQLLLPYLRGNCALPAPAQAAEGYLLATLENPMTNTATLGSILETSPTTWDIQLEYGSNKFSIQIEAVPSGASIRSSCDGDKTHRPIEYRLIQLQVLKD